MGDEETEPFDLSADVPLHHQDTATSCGPACAQMIAAAIGVPLIDQTELDKAFDSPSSWATSPEDLAVSINYCLDHPPCFMHRYYRSRTEAMRAVACSMFKHKRPAAALVDGGSHWVVITGLSGTFDSGNPCLDEPSTKIETVSIRDPAPDIDLLKGSFSPWNGPPPHGGQDQCPSLTTRQEVFDHYEWEGRFSRCATEGPWFDRWVVVCAPWDQPCDMTAAPQPIVDAGSLAGTTGIGGLETAPTPPADPADSTAVTLWAQSEFRRMGLDRREEWRRVLRSDAPCEAHLVDRLDTGGSYYLVVVGQGKEKALLRFDAQTWRLQHAALEPSTAALDNLRLVGDETRRLVWRPCPESRSPLFPLRELKDGRGFRVFNRKFQQLTLLQRALRLPG